MLKVASVITLKWWALVPYPHAVMIELRKVCRKYGVREISVQKNDKQSMRLSDQQQ